MRNLSKTRNYYLSVFLFVLLSLLSCSEEVSVIGWAGPADLTITNLTTGDSRQDKSSITVSNKSPNDIVFRSGDVLQLKFTPPEDYKKDQFTVTFGILDVNPIVKVSPYIYEMKIEDDVPVGSYIATCSAICEKWSEGSSCTQSIRFRVEK